MKKFIPLLLVLFALGAVEIPQAHPQPNGDICYTFFASLSCVAHDRPGATPTPTRPAITATPSRTPTPIPFPTLENADFEAEAGLQAWTPYNANGSLSDLLVETRSLSAGGLDPLDVFSGDKSIMLSRSHACWRGGLYQTLHNVPDRTKIRVTARIMTYGAAHPGIHGVDVNMNSRIGIGFDGLGLTNPNSTRVDWFIVQGGDTIGTIGGCDPVWQLAEHAFVTGNSGALTVFLIADLGVVADGRCDWPMNFTRGRFDAASLEVLP